MCPEEGIMTLGLNPAFTCVALKNLRKFQVSHFMSKRGGQNGGAEGRKGPLDRPLSSRIGSPSLPITFVGQTLRQRIQPVCGQGAKDERITIIKILEENHFLILNILRDETERDSEIIRTRCFPILHSSFECSFFVLICHVSTVGEHRLHTAILIQQSPISRF